ncbi:MAG: rod shape-determining protein MreD [Gammaproteobacteria bacterium]|nr:rod shape-determining protein MreD [Gammaproteobacteria bacterium]
MARVRQTKAPAFAIFITFVLAYVLNLVNYPEWMRYAKPDWVLLVLFYWCLAVPDRVGVGTGWLAGLGLDIFYYALFGQHAVAKAFVAFVAVTDHQHLRLYALWEQCIVVFLVASVDIGITAWIYYVTANIEIQLIYWQSALASCLLWPLVYILLRGLRHRVGIR